MGIEPGVRQGARSRPRCKTLAVAVAALSIAACENSQPPTLCSAIPQQTVFTGESTTVTGCFEDPNGDVLDYAAATSDPGVATAAGNIVTVEAVSPGRAFVTVPEGTVEVGETVTHELASYFRDPDGDALVYSATAADPTVAGVSVSGGAVSVAALAKGAATVTVTATDTEGLVATQAFIVTVPNRAPVAVGTAPADTVPVGELATLDPSPYFGDPDGDPLGHAATSSDPTVTIMATDTEGLTATQAFTVTVPNRAPLAIGALLADTVAVGGTVTLDLSAHFGDPDGDPLVYAATSSDPAVIGVAVSDGAGAITALAKGAATVTVTATDTEGLAAAQAFIVTVPNQAPVTRDPIQPRGFQVGDVATLDLPAHVIDPDGDPLTFTATTSDSAVVSADFSDAALTLTAVAKGGATVTVPASDEEGLSATQAFTISVSDQPPLPAGTIEAWTFPAGGVSHS